jgi:hypothetical protein
VEQQFIEQGCQLIINVIIQNRTRFGNVRKKFQQIAFVVSIVKQK